MLARYGVTQRPGAWQTEPEEVRYSYDDGTIEPTLTALDSHENFYRDIKMRE